MVIRMRIYRTESRSHEADHVFYELVKPIHEKYGARFLGRYVDKTGKYVVMWAYTSEVELQRIQQCVANDPETIKNSVVRIQSGLHGVDFDEYIMTSTDQRTNDE
jgi:hypothetical protein